MRHALVADAVGKSFRHHHAAVAPTFRAWVESGLFRQIPTARPLRRGLAAGRTPGNETAERMVEIDDDADRHNAAAGTK